MKYTVSLLRVLALVGVLMLSSPIVLADETKTTTTDNTTATATRMIGKVTYLLGQAELTLRDGTVVPITKQTEIPEGSKVSVKDRSKLNLMMVDGETEKLPANSTLEFTKYTYDPTNPKASEIRKELIEGGVTTKTGDGGHEARDRYRLNSPLAAIAVLGTEYTVQISASETRVTVLAGEISMAKLGGDCLRSGLGACAGGERLSENQRGLVLIVRPDQPKPVLVPAATKPMTKSEAASATPAAEEASKADEKKDKQAETKADKQETADAPAKSSDKSAEQVTEKASDKTAEKSTDKTTDKVADKSTSATVPDTSTEKTTKKVDERDPLAEVDSTKKTVTSTTLTQTTTKVDERDPLAVTKTVAEVKSTTPATVAVVQTPAVTPVETAGTSSKPTGSTVSGVATNVASTNTTSTNTTLASAGTQESTQSTALTTPTTSTATSPATTAVPTTTPTTTTTLSNPLALVSSSSTANTTGLASSSTSLSGGSLLESATGGGLTGALTTTPLGTSLGGASTDLLESNKGTTSTVTTDTGTVIPAVTPPVVDPVKPVTPVTPVVDPTLPLVRWGKYDPAATVNGSTTFGTQVGSQYEQLVLAAASDYTLERQKGASPSLPEQRDVAFKLGTYEANVKNATTGEKVAATINDATLNVSSAKKTFDTGFTLASTLYNGAVKATGTYSATDGMLADDGKNPQTKIQGAVGVSGDSIGAAYTFTHQIDTQLSAGGALNWAGTAIAAPVTAGTVTTGTTVGN